MKRSQQKQAHVTSAGQVPNGSATASRRGFTLVELLVVIAIIGILIGMLAVSIGPVLTRVHDAAVTSELKQLEQAMESFKNQYGFYPPTCSALRSGAYDSLDPHASDSDASNATDASKMLPYLNKMSPNHGELGPMPGDSMGRSRLLVWWVNVGRHLDERSSLVFWLSGVCANKQFPLTGNLPPVGSMPQLPVAFGVPQSFTVTANGNSNGPERRATSGGVEIDVPRDVFFDFRGGQLSNVALDITTRAVDLPNADARTSPPFPSGIRAYNTPYGDTRANRGNEYLYRNSAFYAPNGGGYHAQNDISTTADDVYVNPNTFQLFTYGRDGLAANVALDDINDPAQSALNRDNITNFANGRLETFDWRANLGL